MEMKVSLGFPTCTEGMMYPVPFATPTQLIELAKKAEQLGYDGVWGNDHMTTQAYVRRDFAEPPNFWEVLITLAFVAAATSKLRIATGVLVPAMRRDIVVMAKQLATLDQFSEGRLSVGLGVGAYREEFEAVHPHWKVNRGELLEESIQALRLLFTERVSSWNGKYYQFDSVEMYPKPLQNPLPFYTGGNNENAVRRAALYAQGWLCAGMLPDQLQENIQKLHEIAYANGRDPKRIDIAVQLDVCIGDSQESAFKYYRESQLYRHIASLSGSTLKDQVKAGTDLEEIDLIGTPDHILEKIDRLRQVGVTHLGGTLFPANTVGELTDHLQRFAEEVMPCIRAW